LRLTFLTYGLYGLCLAFLYGFGPDPSAKYEEEQVYVSLSGTADLILQHDPSWHTSGKPQWFYAKPLALDYDNTAACATDGPCLDPIQYTYTKLPNGHAADGKKLAVNGLAMVKGAGTYLIYSQDTKGTVLHRIAVRRSDDYIGHLTELLGVPFVYFPFKGEGFGHQTDRGLGADCVATLIYGKRRLGDRIPYVSPKRLYDYTLIVGDYRRVEETAIVAGDILHFGFQTAVISQDHPPIGILSDNDKLIHSYHQLVEEVDFSSLVYREMPFDILRWK
jgi:hypothetical protein